MKLRWLILPSVVAGVAAAYYGSQPAPKDQVPNWPGAVVKPEDPAEMLPPLDDEEKLQWEADPLPSPAGE